MSVAVIRRSQRTAVGCRIGLVVKRILKNEVGVTLPRKKQGKYSRNRDQLLQNKFGGSVSLSEDTVVVGAYWDDENGPRSGAAYVFKQGNFDAEIWTETAKIGPDDGSEGDLFGIAVGVSDNTVVVGSSEDDDKGPKTGSAYFFRRNSGGANHWGQFAKVTGTDTSCFDYFGHAVGISGNVAVVGAYGDGVNGNGAGNAYLLVISESSALALAYLMFFGIGWLR